MKKIMYEPIPVMSGELPDVSQTDNWDKEHHITDSVVVYVADGNGNEMGKSFAKYFYQTGHWIINGYLGNFKVTHWWKETIIDIPTDEEIRNKAIEYYGNDPHLYGGQRDGFVKGYKAALPIYPNESVVVGVKFEDRK